jgi:glutamine---fructose-6-phosphate transaminase (isomerizing)
VRDLRTEAGANTLSEIRSEPEVWRECLKTLDSAGELARVNAAFTKEAEWVFTGCGSSFYLAQVAAATWSMVTGGRARAIPASEILLFPELLPASSQPVLISRSGSTSEVIDAARYLRGQAGIETIAITCSTGTPLERVATSVIRLPAADEKSTVMTRSFTSMLLALQSLAGLRGRDERFGEAIRLLPDSVKRRMEGFESVAKSVVGFREFADYVFLGQGPLFGVAQESMLKVKEMSCSYAQAFHTLEFRHGPKAIVGPETLLTFFLSDSGFEAEATVLEEMKELGGTTLVVTNEATAAVRGCADFLIELELDIPEASRAAAAVISGQFLGFYTGIHKGFDPDHPRNLTRVVMLARSKDGEPKSAGS